VFLQVLCALVATVAVVHSEYLNLGPLVVWHLVLLVSWLNDVKYDSDPVFVLLPHQSNVSVRRKALDRPKLLVGCLRILKVGQVGPHTDLQVIVFVIRHVHFWLGAF